MTPVVSRRGPHIPTDSLPSVRPPDRGGGRPRRESRKAAACRRTYCVYCAGLALVLVVVFALGVWQQRSITASLDSPDRTGLESPDNSGARTGNHASLRLILWTLSVERKFQEGMLELLRSERGNAGLRQPRLALVVGSMIKDSQALMLLTLAKGLSELGYRFTIFSFYDGEARYLWEDISYEVHFVGPTSSRHVDWSNYEGVILSSLECQRVIPSLMQEPFLSVPLIWLIHEDILGIHLKSYAEQDLKDLITQWKLAFNRADVIVFPEFALPLIYASLGGTNFAVISGSPADIMETESYIKSHSKYYIRKEYGFGEDDLIIIIMGSYFLFDYIPWDYAATMQALAPQVSKLTRIRNGQVHFIFLCGNLSDAYSSSFQELAKHMGFPDDSVRHYAINNNNVNNLLLISNIVIYGSFQEEPSFPPLLIRAMSFGIPILAPNLTHITKYVKNGVHGFLFDPNDLDTLAKSFSLAIREERLSDLANFVATQGKLLSKNMLSHNYISSHARLLENIIQFPSDVIIPASVSQIKQSTWLWGLFEKNTREEYGTTGFHSRIVDILEDQFVKNLTKNSKFETEALTGDFPSELDWDDLSEIEINEDLERREMEEIEERMEKELGSWEEVYHNARRAEKSKPEKNERDEGELERTGQTVCIYEIYDGEGSWPFLHHDSMYRGISLSRSGRRPGSDDIDAISRLPILSDSYYRDLFCEFGAILAIANRVDSIHKLPWIGFQRTTGKKVSLSRSAEETLEKAMVAESKGDVIYFWARIDLDWDINKQINLDFWSMCDLLNSGHCRRIFGSAFRKMYGLRDEMTGLPHMPDDGYSWSSLYSFVMPTPSFLEFIMFSRMFVDSIDSLTYNSSNPDSCLLGSSKLEKRQCYCRMLELLVNVWAYHSGRKMFYLHPVTGEITEQHPIEERRGVIWSKYFELSLLKSMDEDLAEEADDGTHVNNRWIWPLTGEVHWQGVFDREREERHVKKMDKKRKTKEKLLERQKFGYKQKALSGK